MTSMQTTTKDGTKINVKGAGPEIPSTGGRPPSNKQIGSVITGAHHGLESEKKNLDSHGQEIVSSTQNVLDATSLLINEKNKEERFQKLFLFTKGTQGAPSDGLAKATKSFMTQASGMGSKVSNDATDVLSYIRETILNLTTSGEFRKLTIEFLNLLQSLMGQLQTSVAKADKNKPLKANRIKTQVFETEEDRLDDINEKLGVFLKHVRKQPQYRAVISNFMKYSEEIYDLLYKAKADTSRTKEVDAIRMTLDEGWEILNDFVGDNKLVPKFKRNLQSMLEQIRKDQELTTWMQECKKLLNELMENPENISKDQKRTSKLIKTGGDLTDKYRSDLDRLYSDARRIMDRVQSDPIVMNFQHQLEQLGRDIALNNKGQPDLFVLEKSMNVIRDLLVERFRKVLIDVPIERIHIQNDSMNVTLKNITIQGNGLVPNNLRVEMSSISNFNFDRSTDAAQKFRLRLRVDEICPHFKGVKFNYKKTSFPSVKDKGIADIIFEGKGLSVDVVVHFVIASNQISKAIFKRCTVEVEKVNLKIEEAKHDILGAMFASRIQARLRTKIQSGVYDFVNGRVGQIIDQLNRWFQTRPFETMMVKGNETLQTAASKKDEAKELRMKEKSKRKLEEGKKELTNEEKQKKKEKKLQQQKDGTYVKKDKAHKDGKNISGVGYQSGAPGAYQQQPMMGQQPMLGQQYPVGQQQSVMGQQPMLGQQYPVGQQQNAYQGQGQNPVLMNQQQSYGQQHVPSQVGVNDYGHHQQQQPLHGGQGLQSQQHPNVTQSGQQTQQHFQHPPADQPNQNQYQQQSAVGSADRINKLLDPNFVSQVKDLPSS